MIICFECSAETKRILDKLVQAGAYPDYADVISAAVESHSLLHAEMGNRRSVVLGGEDVRTPHTAHRKARRAGEAVLPVGQRVTSPAASVENAPVRTQARASLPELFRADGLPDTPLNPAELPDDVWMPGQEVPISRWLFGQYNKLLPAKASCRALAHLLVTSPDGVSLSSAGMEISEAASVLGDYLADLDAISGVSRDDAAATAFPRTGSGGDKSRIRFAKQFVGTTNGQGQVSGLLMSLKLINRTTHRDLRVKLTDTGWKLALSSNPVLDQETGRAATRLSVLECELLLNHITSTVPAEHYAYRVVVDGVRRGAKTPTEMDRHIARAMPIDAKGLTKDFITTQRSGVVSRMIDLGLLTRVRDGVRVTYALGDRAVQFAQ